METEHRVGSTLILGTIPGFVPDAQRVAAAFSRHGPDAVVLGVPPEDLDGLAALAADPALLDELPEAPELDALLFQHLAPYGECRIPSPDLERLHNLAVAADVPVTAGDLDDATHTKLYTHNVGFMGVVRSNRLQKRLVKAKPVGADAYEVATWWDDSLNDLKPLRLIEGARAAAMADAIRTAANEHSRVLAVVPIARLGGVIAALTDDAASEP